MNFEREAWRPMFLREPVSQRAWNLVTRGLRAYLVRVAEDDGTLLKRCADPFELAASLAVHAEEIELVRSAIDTLLQDGFLQWEGDANHPAWLGVDRLVTFGPPPHDVGVDADEPAAERRKRQARERKRRSRGTGARDMSRATSVTGSVTQGVTEVRDQRDLPPQSPPSDKEIEIKSGAPARDPSRVTDGVSERDMSRGFKTPKPLRSAGRSVRSPDTGTRGHERIEPQLEHRRYARLHNLDLDACMRTFREDSRSARLSTIEAWAVIMRMLEKVVTARGQGRVGGVS